MITPVNHATYLNETQNNLLMRDLVTSFESRPLSRQAWSRQFAKEEAERMVQFLQQDLFIRDLLHSPPLRLRLLCIKNELLAQCEVIRKYAVEFFSKISPFVCLVAGFLASGSYKLFGSLVKIKIGQVNIAAQQQIQQPQIQPQAEIRTVHHHHEHHVYHHYPQQHDFQQRRQSFSIPTCDRMTFERWNSARSEEIIF